MARSWNWRVVEFSASQREYVARILGDPGHWNRRTALCSTKNCGTRAECVVAYDYVTGRAGRVSTNERPYCRAHAENLVRRKTEAA